MRVTITPVPGTGFHEDVEAGRVVLPDERGMLAEQRTMIAHMDLERALYRGNHISNSLPVGGSLPQDRQALLDLLEAEGVLKDDTLVTLRHNLAQIYLNVGRFEEALELEELAYAERLRTLGPDHLYTRVSAVTLGQIKAALGRE